jgi:hypothetical protein
MTPFFAASLLAVSERITDGYRWFLIVTFGSVNFGLTVTAVGSSISKNDWVSTKAAHSAAALSCC